MTLAVDAKPFVEDTGIIAARHRLLFRFSIVNLAAFALLGAAYYQGWVDQIVLSDTSFISPGIFIVFLGGLGIAAGRVWRLNTEMNGMESGQPAPGSWAARYLAAIKGRSEGARAILGSSLRLTMASSISPVRHVAVSLVLLGLIGTVIGFIISLAGVDPRMTGEASSIAPMVARLIGGMSVALYTTLVGSILNVWLMANYQILNGGAVRLLTSIVERGEADAGS